MMKQCPKKNCQTNEKSHNYVACEDCAMEPICRPVETQSQPLNLSNQYLQKRANSLSDNYLFKEGQPLQDIYSVCSGTFKLTKRNQLNEEKVIGFRFPGELIGEDALHLKVYSHDAQSIGEGSVCKINVEKLMSCSQAIPKLQLSLVELLTRQSYVSQKQFESLISKKSAESLVAAFLLNVARRKSHDEEQPNIVNLSMSRDNIANFLGLRRETLSRIFGKLQKEQLITQSTKQVLFIDYDGLFNLANI